MITSISNMTQVLTPSPQAYSLATIKASMIKFEVLRTSFSESGPIIHLDPHNYFKTICHNQVYQ